MGGIKGAHGGEVMIGAYIKQMFYQGAKKDRGRDPDPYET